MSSNEPQRSAPKRILIVEDNELNMKLLNDVLEAYGYDIVKTASGAAVLELARQHRPDLVLMDIRIKGDMDGIEAAREIRERFDIPAVYLTAHADRETLDRAKLAEPLGYLIKPFHEAELLAAP